MRERTLKIITLILAIIVITTFSSYYYFSTNLTLAKAKQTSLLERIDWKNSKILEKKDELNLTKNKLTSVNLQLNTTREQLEQNLSELYQWQNGSKYELHDPLYEEVIAFIENDTSNSTELEIANAKDKGLRCAYVVILLNDGMYPLIGFDTVDKGMVYFEEITDYQVIPEIGKNYAECVVGHPYIIENYTIVDILIIW